MEGKSSIRNTRLVMVNYLNAEPFRVGLKKYSHLFNGIEISQDIPSNCALSFEKGDSDIALLPVGALHGIKDYQIVTNFGIGCDGPVKTVCLFSNQPPENWKTIFLDKHSRTSVLLTRIIMEDYFKIQPDYLPSEAETQIVEENEAILLIGDKVFDMQNNYRYSYDLGQIWKEMTGLPFVFAVWVINTAISDKNFIAQLQDAFEYGVASIPVWTKNDDLTINGKHLTTYYRENIKYRLTEDYFLSMDLFLKKSVRYL